MKIANRIIFLLFMLANSDGAFADRAAYSGVVNLSEKTNLISVEHKHDWSNPFHESTLKAFDRVKNVELFKVNVPALSYLWISSDSRYIVGLSNIKYMNAKQLVVYSAQGKEIYSADLLSEGDEFKNESVTNWVHWYREPIPEISITENSENAVLKVQRWNGKFKEFNIGAY